MKRAERDRNAFANMVTVARLDMGRRQCDVAEACGRSQGWMAGVERGNVIAQPAMLLRLVEVLRMDRHLAISTYLRTCKVYPLMQMVAAEAEEKWRKREALLVAEVEALRVLVGTQAEALRAATGVGR